ncbi:MAG: hypothetical protein O3A51_09430, partial [Verrucomicrobia bacterium]|nr:hypothetical protein [Verrucomicrobiota bacterium]
NQPEQRRSFPATAIGHRRISIVGSTHTDRDRADAMKQSMEARLETRSSTDLRETTAFRGKLHDGYRRRRTVPLTTNPVERDRERLDAAALSLFETHLAELVSLADRVDRSPTRPEVDEPGDIVIIE